MLSVFTSDEVEAWAQEHHADYVLAHPCLFQLRQIQHTATTMDTIPTTHNTPTLSQ